MGNKFKHGRFKERFLELEDSIGHTLTHANMCNLVDEAKKEIFKVATDAFVDKRHPDLWEKLVEWFGNP